MKWIRVPKFVITIGSFFLILIGFFCGYKCAESIVEKDMKSKSCKPIVEYVDTCKKEEKEEKFTVGDNKYIITTNAKFITMQNDGGSHINVYYEIDLNKKEIVEREDKYVGFKGYEYEGKEQSRKNISDEDTNAIKEIINSIIENPGNVEDSNYLYYVLTTKNEGEIKFYNEEVIGTLNELLK